MSLIHDQLHPKISSKYAHNFLSNQTNELTNRKPDPAI